MVNEGRTSRFYKSSGINQNSDNALSKKTVEYQAHNMQSCQNIISEIQIIERFRRRTAIPLSKVRNHL